MRRFMTLMAALSLLGAVLGCKHVAGVCDCDGCCGTGPTGPMPILKPEPLQMPKADNGTKPANLPLDKENKDDNKENNKDKDKDN